jgi:hypothetical protein
MSYLNQKAKGEREEAVQQALQSRDSEALYKLAELYKEEGEDEYAETLRFAAKKVDQEDLDDQARADQAERELERAEEHYHPAEGNEY